MIFLIEYNRALGMLVQLKAFAASDESSAAKVRLELELAQIRSTDDHEIVILEADSEEALRKTHRRYFETIRVLANPDSPILARKAA